MFFCPPPFMKTDRGPSALIDRTTGTNIGNMTGFSGLPAVFDGLTNQNSSSSALSSSNTIGFSYVGKTFAVPTALDFVVCYGSNDQGYVNNNNGSVTLELYGKNGGPPSSSTDGSLLGSVTFNDTANESGNPRAIASSDTATYWDHGWVRLVPSASNGQRFTELQMTGWQ